MHVYDMTFDWADLSAVPEAASSWAHNGIVVTGCRGGHRISRGATGDVGPERPGLQVGQPGLTEGHGITLVREGDEEFLWVSDPGFVFEVGPG